nr:iron transporter [Vibrio sinus]
MHLSNGVVAKTSKQSANSSAQIQHKPLKRTYTLFSRMNANAMNPNGFITNDFIPYCVLTYKLSKQGSPWHKTLRSPMRLTIKGPEYGVSALLDGPGVYQWEIDYMSPYYGGFYRHTDKATGVAPWWKPFHLTYTFTLAKNGVVGEKA